MLNFKNVEIGYNKSLLENLNFTITPNKITSIVGKNGCGKSTIIRAITDKYLLKQGDISISIDQKDIAKLSQLNQFPQNLTVQEYLSLTRFKQQSIFNIFSNYSNDNAINYSIELCQIQGLLEKKLVELSGGQRQKVFLAFCISQKPKLLILDEPATYLDLKAQHDLIKIIKLLRDKLQLTIICIHHDLEQVLNFSDELLIINNKTITKHSTINCDSNYERLAHVFDIDLEVYKSGRGIHLNYNYNN